MISPISLQKNSVYFSAAFIPFDIIAFGYNFFIRDLTSFITFHHFYGISMFVWLFILIVQASLIRAKRRNLHRVLGKAFYAPASFISVTIVLILHYAFGTQLDTTVDSLILALQLSLLLQFLIIYSCAIKDQKVSKVHECWTLGTAMPMEDPIFNRLIMYTLAPIFPKYELAGVLIAFGATDLLIGALA